VTEHRRKLLAAEARLDALKRQAVPPAGLNELQLRRIWRNLQAEQGPRRRWLRWATVAGLLLLSSGAFAARATITSAVRRLLAPRPATTSETISDTSAAVAQTTGGAHRGAGTAARATDLARPPASTPPAGIRRPAVATRPRPGRTPAPGTLALATPGRDPSALAREAAMTGEAVRHLRRERDPAAALAALSAYRNGFPGGQLQREADRLTVEALLALDRRAEALGFLQRLDLGAGDDLPLRLLRAELATPAGCAEAVADFTAVITERTPGLLERALIGRARCRDHLGDPAGSARDLAACQRRFPRGRCAGGRP
jgi:hypothetical protein